MVFRVNRNKSKGKQREGSSQRETQRNTLFKRESERVRVRGERTISNLGYCGAVAIVAQASSVQAGEEGRPEAGSER